MCTVVVRSAPPEPARVLALRDELTSRPFDDPSAWWPDQPDVVGGRDRLAGGTWCASKVSTGVTALVLNRPHKRVATDGAPSRGVLPLLAVAHEQAWPQHVDVGGMASFALVLVTAWQVSAWQFDGTTLTAVTLPAGTHMLTSGGAEDGKADRYLAAFERADYPAGWRELVQAAAPSDDVAALVVRRPIGDRVYATVFGQLLDAEPGRLDVDYSRTPWLASSWSHQRTTSSA